MKMEIRTEILIQSSPSKIWEVLTDTAKYPKWNPFIKSLSGKLMVGETIKAEIQAPESSKMVFKPKVLSFKKEKEFSWLGHLLMPGLFDGNHIFELIDNENGSTTFVHREKFSGILVGMFKKQLETNTKQGFELMNERLKELAESK